MNRLKLNKNKTALLICPSNKKYKHKITLFPGTDDEVKCTSHIKILGSVYSPAATAHAELNATISSCYHKLNILQGIKDIADTKTKVQFINSYIISRILFSITSFSSLPQYHLKKLHNIIMALACFARGNVGYRVNTNNILSPLNMLNYRQLIYARSVIECHKYLYSKQPENIYQMIRVNNRSCAKIGLRFPPRTSLGSKIS